MASALFLFPYVLVTLICTTLLVQSQCSSINHKTNEGFSISVIHRDSPESPFYNQSMTNYDRVIAAVRRSINRRNDLLMSLSTSDDRPPVDIPIKLTSDRVEYLTTVSIGSSKTQVSLTLDTGSSLNWVKGPPTYDASKSISYRLRSCSIDGCPLGSTCNSQEDKCDYRIDYLDGSSSSGTISYEDFTFDDPELGSSVTVNNLMFGYGTNVSGFYDPENGILGLNREANSFLALVGITKFSHCFASWYSNPITGGRMNFGTSAVMGDFATAILQNPRSDNYYVNLNVVTVGEKRVDMPPGVFKLNGDGRGGVIIDTGTTFTHLITEAYEPFLKEIKQRVNRTLINSPDFDLCFSGNFAELDDLPDVTFMFENVGVQLIKQAVYVEVYAGALCVAMVGGPDITIFGNYQMRNMIVGYDLQKLQISFGKADCYTPH